jgi:calcineurin-like phosphoesterase family protein
MTNTFYISDTHFGHRNIIDFKRNDGTPLRDFKSVEEMDECMVYNWNSTVKPNDTVYHLGDVVINRKSLQILNRLIGRKVLIRGNHDIFKLKDYAEYFEDVRGYKVMPSHGIICSHIPIHPSALERWKYNFHGHLHSNHVLKQQDGVLIRDEKYVNLSVEQINYTPISFDELRKKLTLD